MSPLFCRAVIKLYLINRSEWLENNDHNGIIHTHWNVQVPARTRSAPIKIHSYNRSYTYTITYTYVNLGTYWLFVTHLCSFGYLVQSYLFVTHYNVTEIMSINLCIFFIVKQGEQPTPSTLNFYTKSLIISQIVCT